MAYFEDDDRCKWQRNYVNLPAWDKYTGEGITIFHDDLGNTSHNEACVDIIQTILPKAKIYSGRINHNANSTGVTKCTIHCNETGETLACDEFIEKYDISLFNNSTTGGTNNSDSPIAKFWREKIKKHNLICTGAFGNYNSVPTNRYQGAWLMISGVSLLFDYSFADYGVSGDACDFSMFMGFQSGTSFASPFMLGLIGKLRSRYGRDITQDQVKEYFKARCEDLGDPGWEPQFGWGLPKLGDPDMTKIEMMIGSPIMLVNGKEVPLLQPPKIVRASGTTLVPIRSISEAFGADVGWDPVTKKITITLGDELPEVNES